MEKSVSMIAVDTGRSFDISVALNKMRTEYEKSVQQHREEADAYYKLKVPSSSSVSLITLSALVVSLQLLLQTVQLPKF